MSISKDPQHRSKHSSDNPKAAGLIPKTSGELRIRICAQKRNAPYRQNENQASARRLRSRVMIGTRHLRPLTLELRPEYLSVIQTRSSSPINLGHTLDVDQNVVYVARSESPTSSRQSVGRHTAKRILEYKNDECRNKLLKRKSGRRESHPRRPGSKDTRL